VLRRWGQLYVRAPLPLRARSAPADLRRIKGLDWLQLPRSATNQDQFHEAPLPAGAILRGRDGPFFHFPDRSLFIGPVVHQLHNARQPAGYVHPHRNGRRPGNLRWAPESDLAQNRALTGSRLFQGGYGTQRNAETIAFPEKRASVCTPNASHRAGDLELLPQRPGTARAPRLHPTNSCLCIEPGFRVSAIPAIRLACFRPLSEAEWLPLLWSAGPI